jgi:hypothetical protein
MNVVVIVSQIIPNACSQKQLFCIAYKIKIAKLYLMMPIPFFVYFFITKINKPIAEIAFLGLHYGRQQ